MSVCNCIIWGLLATGMLTSVLGLSQAFGLTRMSLPYLVGTMFTCDRDRAKVIGMFVHTLNGIAFSVMYAIAFSASRSATWWFGALLGAVHGIVVLAVGLPSLPGLHPRMTSGFGGPSGLRQLEPPGFLALNYGVRTPAAILLAHVLYGAVLGGSYFVD